MTTKFEQLSNELILICFSYFDFYELYDLFFSLNQRFNQLIQYQTKMHINLSSIPSGKFFTFFFHLNRFMTTTQNYPLSIIANDKCELNVILQDDLFKEKFSKLKSLTLTNIDVEAIYSIIFEKKAELYNSLERLTLLEMDRTADGGRFAIENLCDSLISSKMKMLKYLNLNFQRFWCRCGRCSFEHDSITYLYFNILTNREEKSLSSLETIIIGNISDDDYGDSNTTVCFHSLITELLPCLPKLKNLIINSVHFEDYDYNQNHKVCEKRY
ncbi:unnamed protein product [Rotaria sp. Silwood1]|nr:unnamed protein product [Rotaria sp. Silwood1]CAF4984839.1 unnamed protein product [Rotaria sp. Silwood1]